MHPAAEPPDVDVSFGHEDPVVFNSDEMSLACQDIEENGPPFTDELRVVVCSEGGR